MNSAGSDVQSAAVSTAVSSAAGLIGGPVAAAVAGFICGCPGPVLGAGALAVVIWVAPVTGIWLAVMAVSSAVAFILGTLRKPPPGVFRAVVSTADAQRITDLQTQLRTARMRADQAEHVIYLITGGGCLPPDGNPAAEDRGFPPLPASRNRS